jgi:hypothetical protein
MAAPMQRIFGYSRLLTTGAPAPSATVTVYAAGTLTLASIFGDNLSTPTPKANPFTADTSGFFFFYGPDARYDVRFSGGGIVSPYSWGDVLASGAFGLGWLDVQRNYGALGDGTTDDTAAIQAALTAGSGTVVYFPPATYRVNASLFVLPNTTLLGYGATLNAVGMVATPAKPGSGLTTNAQTLVLNGSNTLGQEVANVLIQGLTLINNALGSHVLIWGGPNGSNPPTTFTYKPHHITVRDVSTTAVRNNLVDGVEIDSGKAILVDSCSFTGGNSGVTGGAPTTAPTDLDDLAIVNCHVDGTNSYGYQIAFGRRSRIANCFVDGTGMAGLDKNGINMDKTQGFTVTGNVVKNCPNYQILCNGGAYGTIVGNRCDGGGVGFGITVNGNFDYLIDAATREALYVTVVGNEIDNLKAASNAIIFNGAKGCVMVGNTIGPLGAGSVDILVSDVVRGDSVTMLSSGVTVVGNVCKGLGTIQMVQAATDCTCVGNVAATYLGVTPLLVGQNVVLTSGNKLDLSNGNTLYRDAVTGYVNLAGGGRFVVAPDVYLGPSTFSHSGNNVGFYGVSPVLRQLLATGVGHTVDDVIATLQLLGLLRQS